MANEFDRKLIPEFLQTSFTIWLGAAYKSVEMMMSPQQSMSKVVSEVKSLFTVPSDAGEGLQKKVEAVASEWMRKGATLVEECKTTGRKFTDSE